MTAGKQKPHRANGEASKRNRSVSRHLYAASRVYFRPKGKHGLAAASYGKQWLAMPGNCRVGEGGQ